MSNFNSSKDFADFCVIICFENFDFQKEKGNLFIMFRCQPGYTLRKIKDTCYLLPYGQQIADQKKSFILNETSSFLWNILQHNEGAEPEELVKLLARVYQLDESFFPELCSDVMDFLTQLTGLGMITEDLHPISKEPSGSMVIAGITMNLYGPRELFSKCFEPFYKKFSAEPDQILELITAPPASRCYEQVLLQNSEMTIFENSDRYVVLFPQMQNIYEAHMLKDGSYVRIHCHAQATELNTDNLFHAIRLFFLFIAQKKGLFAIHSASILYHDKAWLFSGHSGMGKSTHTALWHELFGTPYLNGDLNLLGFEDGHITVYGIPWCGTSEIFTTEQYELGGIVLLGRDSQTDRLEKLPPSEKILRVMQRMISPAWKEIQLTRNLSFAEKIADCVPVLHFLCTKNPSAAHTMKNAIDLRRSCNER